ncbi:MAG: ATP-binding cassette domain-containing protein [Flavobacteriales bacterium]
MMIRIEKLSKSFGSKLVLDSIGINFEKGKVYGIVGENGSGKTTLFRCITGLEKYNGNIHSELDDLKNHIGLLLTESFFMPRLTGLEYIKLLLKARDMDIKKIHEKNIFDLPLDKYATTYSTGMKKKLALTAILLQNNSVFILDEPFNGVDIQSNMIIVEIIKTLKAKGKTVIISSHIFSTLAETCDEIHVLEYGRFVTQVQRENFSQLENKMKMYAVGNLVDKLGI